MCFYISTYQKWVLQLRPQYQYYCLQYILCLVHTVRGGFQFMIRMHVCSFQVLLINLNTPGNVSKITFVSSNDQKLLRSLIILNTPGNVSKISFVSSSAQKLLRSLNKEVTGLKVSFSFHVSVQKSIKIIMSTNKKAVCMYFEIAINFYTLTR